MQKMRTTQKHSDNAELGGEVIMDIIYNEETGKWEEKPEPFAVIECQTEEDWDFLQAAVDHYKKRGKWEYIASNSTGNIYCCSNCGKWYNPNEQDVRGLRIEEQPEYCYHCGAKMG